MEVLRIKTADKVVFTFKLLKSKAILIGCKEYSEKIIWIPAFVKGRPVTEIGTGAFTRSKARKIILPDTTKKICSGAFYCCYNLEKITFRKNLLSIEKTAFYKCTSLKSIEFSYKSKAIISELAFYDCPIVDVKMPRKTYKFIETNVFDELVKDLLTGRKKL